MPPKRHAIWDMCFILGDKTPGKNYYPVHCSFCPTHWKHGKLDDALKHIAHNCSKVPLEYKEFASKELLGKRQFQISLDEEDTIFPEDSVSQASGPERHRRRLASRRNLHRQHQQQFASNSFPIQSAAIQQTQNSSSSSNEQQQQLQQIVPQLQHNLFSSSNINNNENNNNSNINATNYISSKDSSHTPNNPQKTQQQYQQQQQLFQNSQHHPEQQSFNIQGNTPLFNIPSTVNALLPSSSSPMVNIQRPLSTMYIGDSTASIPADIQGTKNGGTEFPMVLGQSSDSSPKTNMYHSSNMAYHNLKVSPSTTSDNILELNNQKSNTKAPLTPQHYQKAAPTPGCEKVLEPTGKIQQYYDAEVTLAKWLLQLNLPRSIVQSQEFCLFTYILSRGEFIVPSIDRLKELENALSSCNDGMNNGGLPCPIDLLLQNGVRR